MKTKNFAVMLAFVTATGGSLPTVFSESPANFGTVEYYQSIPITIPSNRGKAPSPPPARGSGSAHRPPPPPPIRHTGERSLPTPETLGNYKPIPISIPNTRSNEKFDLKPQPGYDVTLLLNHKVHFAWSNKNSKKFTIKDENGKTIWEQDIGGKNEIDIVPSEINLKTGEKYLWNVDGISKNYKFAILKENIEKELLENLSTINAENLPPDECILKKATYLLMLSEKLSPDIDLYWLIAQLVSEISPTDENLAEKKSDLLQRCSEHLDDEMF